MNILNIMLGKKSGGLEQAAIDYHEALAIAGFEVHSIIHPDAAIKPKITKLKGNVHYCSHWAEWDVTASYKLKAIAKDVNADVAICHGNRAIGLTLRGLQPAIPVVGVAHNYNIKKRFQKCDAVFCITHDLINEMIDLNISRDQLCHIPNLTRCPDAPIKTANKRNSPITIGTMGRFVPKKGFDCFIRSLSHLVEEKFEFRAVIGGSGPEMDNLKILTASLGLEKHIEFPGWIENKAEFFKNTDLFVLPSYHEPFGIVLIEAMAAGLACISTETEGPREIIQHNQNGILIPTSNPAYLARAITGLIRDNDKMSRFEHAAYQTVRQSFDIKKVSSKLAEAIHSQFSVKSYGDVDQYNVHAKAGH